MKLKVLAFAQAREWFGFDEATVECLPDETPRQILEKLKSPMPVNVMRIALDLEYCEWDQRIGQARELAILPPVSGG